MVTLEQKLALFSKLLQQDVNNEIGEKIHQMEKAYEDIVAEHKRKVDSEARHIVEKSEKKGEAKRLELVSKAKIYTKKQGMQVKEKYIELFINKLSEKVVAFTKESAYKQYIESLLTQVEGIETTHSFIIYMTSEDLAHYGDVVKNYLIQMGLDGGKLKLEAKDTHMLAGFILVDPEKSMRIDLSAYTMIQDNKDFIIEKVFQAIGEVGEGNA